LIKIEDNTIFRLLQSTIMMGKRSKFVKTNDYLIKIPLFGEEIALFSIDRKIKI